MIVVPQVGYPVARIFHSLQGEGHFVGYPMTFVRLAGCSVAGCRIRMLCDEAPWKATETLSPTAISIKIGVAHPGPHIVCITGGEPTDHNLLPLIERLRADGHRVHIETSGERSIEGLPLDWITVSPKTDGYEQRQGHALKIVVLPEWGPPPKAWDMVAAIDAGTNFFHRYLQPLSGPDGKPVNLTQVVEMLTGGYRNAGARWALSAQAHKAWGVP